MNRKAVILLVTGAGMLVLGWLVLCAQVMRLLQPSFFASFFGYGLSFLGLLVGLGGVIHLIQVRKGRNTH